MWNTRSWPAQHAGFFLASLAVHFLAVKLDFQQTARTKDWNWERGDYFSGLAESEDGGGESDFFSDFSDFFSDFDESGDEEEPDFLSDFDESEDEGDVGLFSGCEGSDFDDDVLEEDPVSL